MVNRRQETVESAHQNQQPADGRIAPCNALHAGFVKDLRHARTVSTAGITAGAWRLLDGQRSVISAGYRASPIDAPCPRAEFYP